MKKSYGKLDSITFIKHVSEGVDYLKLNIEFDELYFFGSYNEILSLQGEEVEYTAAPDYVEGKQVIVIRSFAERYTVQTLEKVDNIKLIPKKGTKNQICDLDISSLKFGDTAVASTMFMAGYQKGSSAYSTWYDCDMVDSMSKRFKLRLFSKGELAAGYTYEQILDGYTGHYIRADVTYSAYGYQTKNLELVPVTVAVPPEVDIAYEQIKKAIANDAALVAFENKYNLLNNLRNVIYGELGYHLVNIATEIYYIKALENVSEDYNIETLIRAAVCTRVCYINVGNVKFSNMLLNITRVMDSPLGKDKELMLILDMFNREEVSVTKRIFFDINTFVTNLLDERRAINSNNDFKDEVDSIISKYNGLI